MVNKIKLWERGHQSFEERKKRNETIFDINFVAPDGTIIAPKNFSRNYPKALTVVVKYNSGYEQLQKLDDPNCSPILKRVAEKSIKRLGRDYEIGRGNENMALFSSEYEENMQDYDELSLDQRKEIGRFIESIPAIKKHFSAFTGCKSLLDRNSTKYDQYIIDDRKNMDYVMGLLYKRAEHIYNELGKKALRDYNTTTVALMLVLRNLATKNPYLYKKSSTYLSIGSKISFYFFQCLDGFDPSHEKGLNESKIEKFFKEFDIPEIFTEIKQFIPRGQILGRQNIRSAIQEIIAPAMLGVEFKDILRLGSFE